jgi:hypothetical protein
MAALKNAGARIVLANLGAGLATWAFSEAAEHQVDAAHGFHWVGTEETFRNLDLSTIENAQERFAGAAFLTPLYGLGPASQAFQAPTVGDWRFVREQGGMDPFWVRDASYKLREANMWVFSEAMLALDVVYFYSFALFAAIRFGMTLNAVFVSSLWNWVDNLAMHSGSAINFNSDLSRLGFTGVWVQPLPGDWRPLQQEAALTGKEFLPWSIRTVVDTPSASEAPVELRFTDPRTGLTSDWPTVSTNLTLTRRVFQTRASLDRQEAVFQLSDMVPVTHICEGGCGGGLVNASESAFRYQQGECVAPNQCLCRTRDRSPKKAFFGANCESPLCDNVCRNGECVFEAGDTNCNCSSGWDGPRCDVALCLRYGCNALHGTCSLPDVCSCSPGWYGSSCSGECQCVSGACNDGTAGTGACTCQVGFFGPTCALACTCQNGICNDGAAGNGMCSSCSPGWMGDNCDLQVIVVALPSAAAAALLLALAVFLMRWFMRVSRHRALLANMDWKVDWNDVQLQSNDGEVSQKLESMMYLSAMSLRNPGQRWAADDVLGKYRGGIVMIERLERKVVDLSVELRKEIRDLRELHHINLHAFIGACIEAPNVAILREHCQKGSLEDILANADVRLDETFKFSILKDVAAGMRFLHQSSFRWHGRLCTSNCYVDNRWTVKISGTARCVWVGEVGACGGGLQR